MRLERLIIRGFCQLVYVDVAFHPGLSALLGANGAGKSNFIGAIAFALTGKNPNTGEMAANISQLIDTTAPSDVYLAFSHAGLQIDITRYLRPEKKSLMRIRTADGRTEEVLGSNAVNARIEAILGVDGDMLNQFVLVSQEDLFGFLDHTPAKRGAAFQKLFRTEAASDVYNVLGKYQATIQIPTVGADTDFLQQQITVCDQLLAGYQQDAEGLPVRPAATRQRDLALQAVNALDAYQQAQAEVTNTSQQLAVGEQNLLNDKANLAAYRTTLQTQQQTLQQCESTLQNLDAYARYQQFEAAVTQRQTEVNATTLALDADTTSLTQATEQLQQLKTVAADASATADQARAALLQWDNYQQAEKTRQNLADQIRAATQERAMLVQPPAPHDYLATPAYTAQVITPLQQALQQDRALLQAFADGRAECPTCHTPTTNILPAIEAAKGRLAVNGPRLEQCQQNLRAFDLYERALSAFTHSWQQLDARRVMLDQQAVQLAAPQASIANPGDAQQHVQRFEGVKQQLQQSQDFVDNLSQRVARGDGVLTGQKRALVQAQQELAAQPVVAPVSLDPALRQTLRQQRETLATQVREGTQFAEQSSKRIDWSEGQLTAQRTSLMQSQQRLASLPVMVGDRTFLQQALITATNVLDRVDALQQQIVVQQTTKQNYAQQIANNVEIAKKAARSKELLALIARAQALVHHQAAPRFVAQRKLETLQQVLNELLATMNAEYRVTAEEGLSFIAHFPDGRHQAAERLSYGQSTILVLCFRLALHVTCVPDLGLLVLDEPTAYLDADHIRGFEHAIDRLREYAASRGLQVVIVTHEATLAPLFDATIRLGRPAPAIPAQDFSGLTQAPRTGRSSSAAPNLASMPRQG